jgi:hypothetical protein
MVKEKSMTEDEAMKCLDYIRDNSPRYAEAKAQRVYIENFLRSKKSFLMNECPSQIKTLGDKEAYAYAHPDYVELLKGLQAAVSTEEEIKWRMEAAKLKFEFWKTEQFNNRVEARAMS